MLSPVIFVFGLMVGSFLNVVIVRLATGESPLGSRSRCPRCRQTIAWYDNIPLVSFVLLGRRCRRCRAPIAWQYPLVELATGAVFALLFWRFGLTLDAFILAVFSCFLIIIFVYDWRHSLILDVVTVPAMAVAVVGTLLRGFTWSDLLLGAVIGGGFFAAQFLVSRGRWIGGGDIRLGSLMGLMLGLQQLLVAGLLAYVVGAAAALPLLVSGRKQLASPMPFGTFLTAATFITFLCGPPLLSWYLQFIA